MKYKNLIQGNGEGLSLIENFEVYYMLNGLVDSGSIEISFSGGKADMSRRVPADSLRAKVLKAKQLNIVRGTNNRFGTSKRLI